MAISCQTLSTSESKNTMNRILTLYIFLLLCGTVAAQRTVEWNDLQTLTDDARRTVYYKKDSKRPLQGKYRIIRGLDEEHVKLSDGMINGDYRCYRDGKLDGSYRVESTWEGKPYITIEGQYTDGEKSGQWIQHNYQDNTQTCTWHGEGGA